MKDKKTPIDIYIYILLLKLKSKMWRVTIFFFLLEMWQFYLSWKFGLELMFHSKEDGYKLNSYVGYKYWASA